MASPKRKEFLIIFLLVVASVCIHVTQGQNETFTAIPSPREDLYSPGYLLGQNYTANLTYDYLVTTNYFNHTLTLTVVDCQIEHDKLGNCLYDHLRIYDGPDSNSTLLVDFCCPSSGTQPSYTTTGNQSYLVFTSDTSNHGRGFKIRYESTGITTTIPTTTTTTTTTTPMPVTTAAAKDSNGGNNSLYIIIGCAIGGLILLILLIILIVCCVMKSKRPVTPADSRDTKRVLWSRSATMVKEFHPTPTHLPPGTVTQTNIFEMNLPDSGRGNLLPPLSSKLELPGPAVEAPPDGKPF